MKSFLVLKSPTPLCQFHYYLVYDVLKNVPRWCATCDAWLKHKPCPNPAKHLRQNTGFEGSIDGNSRVCMTCCMTCYKAHLVVVGDHNSETTDKDLLAIMHQLSQTSIDKAMNETMKHVGHILQAMKSLSH